jgi:hypothetical protein
MYTLLELKSKTFGELKKIGYELNVLPAGDRRYRQSWIDALVNVNPPLLQLLAASPAASVEQVQEAIEVQSQEAPIESKFGSIVYPQPAQKAIAPVAENSPGVEVDRGKRSISYLDCPACGTVGGLYATCPGRDTIWETRCTCCSYAEPSIRHPFEDVRPFEVDRAREPIEYPPGMGYLCRTGYSCRYVEIEVKCPRCSAPGLFSTKDYYDRPVISCRECDYGRVKSYPGAIQIPVRETIAKVNEVFPGVGFDRAASTALRASVFEIVPEPPGTDLFSQTIPFYTALRAYYDRYPCGRYRDGRHKINTKIFLGLPEIPGDSDETRPQIDRAESADVHNRRSHSAKSDRDSGGAKTEAPGSQEGDRVLAVARDCETDRGRVLPDQPVELASFTEAARPNRGDDSCDQLGNEPRTSQSAIAQAAKTSPGVEVDRAENLIVGTVETSPGVALVEDELPECSTCFGDGYVEDEFGFVKFCQCKTKPRLSHQKTQRERGLAAKNLPGSRSKASTAHQLLELFKSSAHIIEASPGVKTEATVSESVIAQAAQKFPGVDCVDCQPETDLNPILTGVVLSDRFLARHSPPQSEIHYKADTDGQLSLLDFEIESSDEPPDPDDFESLDAFREAIARWDWEHPSSSDHCSDHCSDQLPSSEDNDVSSEDKPLELSLDSFCLWTHCPADWYEPAALLEPSKVMELSPVHKNSSTSDFFIPTFDRFGDRSNRSDEPPDTGIFARLPKPKPPTFPPQAASWTQVGRKLDTSWTQVSELSRSYPEAIPKIFHRVAAGSSTQPARSPPGGDARRGQ